MNSVPVQFVCNLQDMAVSVNGATALVKSVIDELLSLPTIFVATLPASIQGELGESARDWQQKTESLISFYHEYDKPKAMLVLAKGGTSNILGNEPLSNLLGVQIERIQFSRVGKETAMDMLLLEAYIKSDMSCFLVFEEANALSLVKNEQEFQSRKQLCEAAFREARSFTLACEENRLLLMQLHQVQEELENTYIEIDKVKDGASIKAGEAQISIDQLTKENQILVRNLNNANKMIEEATEDSEDLSSSAVKQLKSENELLLIQLHQVQEELEHYFLQYSNAGASGLTAETSRGSKIVIPKLKKQIKPYRKQLFSKSYYRKQAGKKLFVRSHYERKGASSGLNPHPLFDTEYYLKQVEESLDELTISPLEHFLSIGDQLNISPSPYFDSNWYLDQYPDVASSGVPPLVHFIVHGWKEGRSPNSDFDCKWYLEKYPDVKASEMNPLEHYAQFGNKEGRMRHAYDV